MKTSSIKKQLINTAGDIVIEAVKFGLDEAGARILGPTAWNGFKLILTPVIKKLKQKFPELSFNKSDNDNAINAANEAAEYLKNSQELENLLITNFVSLEEGQDEILTGLQRIEKVVQQTSKDLEAVKKLSEEILDEIKNKQQSEQSNVLSDWVDVTELVEQNLVVVRMQYRRRGEELNQTLNNLVYYSLAIGIFMVKVLEEGTPLKLYKSDIGGIIVSANTYGKYKDNNGRVCRKITTDVPQFGNFEVHNVTTTRFYRQDGSWKEDKKLDTRQYIT